MEDVERGGKGRSGKGGGALEEVGVEGGHDATTSISFFFFTALQFFNPVGGTKGSEGWGRTAGAD